MLSVPPLVVFVTPAAGTASAATITATAAHMPFLMLPSCQLSLACLPPNSNASSSRQAR